MILDRSYHYQDNSIGEWITQQIQKSYLNAHLFVVAETNIQMYMYPSTYLFLIDLYLTHEKKKKKKKHLYAPNDV